MAWRKIVKKIRKETAYVFVRLIVGTLRILPRRAALGVGSIFGRIIPYFAAKELKRASEHLMFAFGDEKNDAEIMRMARETFRQIAMNFVDTVRIRSMSHEELKNWSVPHNMERLSDALAGGNGVIVLASHTGCWEWSGAYLSITGTPLSAITTKLYDSRLEQMLVDTREYAGINVVSRGDNTRDILRTLKNKGAVGVLVDQDTKVKGEFVEFFGRPAHTATAPAVLSMRYNSPIIPVLTYRDDTNRHHICIGEPVTIEPTGDNDRDIREITCKCSKATEDFIKIGFNVNSDPSPNRRGNERVRSLFPLCLCAFCLCACFSPFHKVRTYTQGRFSALSGCDYNLFIRNICNISRGKNALHTCFTAAVNKNFFSVVHSDKPLGKRRIRNKANLHKNTAYILCYSFSLAID